MWSFTKRSVAHTRLLPLAGILASSVFWIQSPGLAQIYLNPNNQNMTRNRVSIELGNGIRCSSDGGSVASLSFSAGAYPDQLGNNSLVVSPQVGNSSIANQSSLMALASVNIPLGRTDQKFDCTPLLKDAIIKARIENLRQLVDEDVISESQYRKALIKLFGPLSNELGISSSAPASEAGATLTIPAASSGSAAAPSKVGTSPVPAPQSAP